ncbi:MAG: triphosphoribosyl-dephospho-CoA synthase [Burkholderiales bacterium]
MTPEFRAAVSDAMRAACIAEIRAFKPGNVSIASAGHGMSARDFIVSAQAAARALSGAGLSVGERILHAVRATRDEVGCNTNLGIVLLCAPLVHAALEQTGAATLRVRLKQVLANLSVHDAERTFEAIRLASPGGLGTAEKHDVRQPATVTLLEAMREAAERDRIAYQYISVFKDVFDIGSESVRQGLKRWGSEDWAAVLCYLDLLGRFTDTHIVRKWGLRTAQRVSEKASRLEKQLRSSPDAQHMMPVLRDWDEELKRDGINPGTSADLTVASLLAVRLEGLLEHCFKGCDVA